MCQSAGFFAEAQTPCIVRFATDRSDRNITHQIPTYEPLIDQIPALLVALLIVSVAHAASNLTADMKESQPDLKSIGPIAFGPDGILLVADTKGAAVVAIATGDTTPAPDAETSSKSRRSIKKSPPSRNHCRSNPDQRSDG